ncbi:MAG: hypothetical protein EBZ61_04810 [Micrococcales bacterium]|nr:hypothetical protein [Micrococcales bacterium]
MKFQVNRDVLADSVAFAARMLQSKPTSIVANVEQAGTTLVSGRLLNEIVSRLPNQPITFQQEGSKVVLTCGTSKFELATLPIEQYPTLPPIPVVSGTIEGDAFINAIRRVSVASAKDSTRPFQKGIQIKAYC